MKLRDIWQYPKLHLNYILLGLSPSNIYVTHNSIKAHILYAAPFSARPWIGWTSFKYFIALSRFSSLISLYSMALAVLLSTTFYIPCVLYSWLQICIWAISQSLYLKCTRHTPRAYSSYTGRFWCVCTGHSRYIKRGTRRPRANSKPP